MASTSQRGRMVFLSCTGGPKGRTLTIATCANSVFRHPPGRVLWIVPLKQSFHELPTGNTLSQSTIPWPPFNSKDLCHMHNKIIHYASSFTFLGDAMHTLRWLLSSTSWSPINVEPACRHPVHHLRLRCMGILPASLKSVARRWLLHCILTYNDQELYRLLATCHWDVMPPCSPTY